MKSPSLKALWQARSDALNEVRHRQLKQAASKSQSERLQAALELSSDIRNLGVAGSARHKPTPSDYSWRERLLKRMKDTASG